MLAWIPQQVSESSRGIANHMIARRRDEAPLGMHCQLINGETKGRLCLYAEGESFLLFLSFPSLCPFALNLGLFPQLSRDSLVIYAWSLRTQAVEKRTCQYKYNGILDQILCPCPVDFPFQISSHGLAKVNLRQSRDPLQSTKTNTSTPVFLLRCRNVRV